MEDSGHALDGEKRDIGWLSNELGYFCQTSAFWCSLAGIHRFPPDKNSSKSE